MAILEFAEYSFMFHEQVSILIIGLMSEITLLVSHCSEFTDLVC